MTNEQRRRALTAARVRRYRQRQREQAEHEAYVTARRVKWLCDRLEAEQPAFVEQLRQLVPPEIAGEVVDELLTRDQRRAAGAPRSPEQPRGDEPGPTTVGR